MLKKILLVLLMLLLVIQFFRPEKNLSAGPMPNNISTVYAVPADVQVILNKACNDCHSNNTRYPWYAEVQPVRWWLQHHVDDGKGELNMDEFAKYSPRKQYHKLEELEEMVKKGEMPLDSYTWIHTEADLSNAEQQQLISWSQHIRDTMKMQYPADSLKMKPRPTASR